jgi:hypothetical protein
MATIVASVHSRIKADKGLCELFRKLSFIGDNIVIWKSPNGVWEVEAGRYQKTYATLTHEAWTSASIEGQIRRRGSNYPLEFHLDSPYETFSRFEDVPKYVQKRARVLFELVKEAANELE